MAMKPARQPGQFQLAVQNQGNHPLELELGGYQAEKLLNYQITPSRFTIEPGATQQVILRVTPARAISEGKRVPFAVVAHSLDIAGYQAPLMGYYSDSARSLSSGWLAGLLGLPILALLGVVVVLLAAGALVVAGVVRLPQTLTSGSLPGAPSVAVTATPRPPEPTPPPTAIPTPAVDLTSFTAEPTQTFFGTVEHIQFRWVIDNPGNARNYILREEASGQPLPMDVSAPSVSRVEITPATLVAEFGWGEHAYTLTVTGRDNVERSSTVSVKIDPVICDVLPAAQIYPQPGQSSGTPVPVPPSKEVVLSGRTEDGASVYVWDLGNHAPLGWVRSSGLTCPLTPSLNEYIIVSPWPPVTNTPAG
jgi:hypothetical protein